MHECTFCGVCCRFSKEDMYFSPLFTDKEIDRLKKDGRYRDYFRKYKDSQKVVQMKLRQEPDKDGMYECQYYDCKTGFCTINDIKPFDCEFWPFTFMFNKDKTKVYWACFVKDTCAWTDSLSEEKWQDYLKRRVQYYKDKIDIRTFLKEYPELIWDYEEDCFFVEELDV